MAEQQKAQFDKLSYLLAYGSPIPLKASTKEPMIKWATYKRRRPTESELARWQEAWPNCNWGLIPGPGIIILDIDGKAGQDWLIQKGGLPITPIVQTRRGQHVYLQRPPELSGLKLPAKLHKGVEIIKTYSLLPGSTHPSGSRYEWIISPEEAELAYPHPWLVEFLKKAGSKAKNIPSPSKSLRLRNAFCKQRTITETDILPEKKGLHHNHDRHRWAEMHHRRRRSPVTYAAEATRQKPITERSAPEIPRELLDHPIWRAGLCKGRLSCNSLLVTRAIMHFNLGHDATSAYNEILAWQEQFSDRYPAREVQKKVAYCYERQYGCDPEVVEALTGLEYKLCGEFGRLLIDYSPYGYRGQREHKSDRLSTFEINQRLMQATISYLTPKKLTIKELALEACISESTLKQRIYRKQLPPLIKIVTTQGRNGGILVWNLWIWLLIWILTITEEKVTNFLMCIYRGGRRRDYERLGERLSIGYKARAPTN